MTTKTLHHGIIGGKIFIYLVVVFGIYYLAWLAAVLVPEDVGKQI